MAATNPQDAAPRRRRLSGSLVLTSLVLLFGLAPFLEEMPAGDLIEAMLLTVVLCAAVASVGLRQHVFYRAVLLASLTVASRWLHFFRPGLFPPELHVVLSMLTICYITMHFLRYVLLARRVTTDVLCTGISAFLMLALAWAIAYVAVEDAIPGSFSFAAAPDSGRTMHGFVAIYFSMVTLCTVGFGDIVPVSNVARMLAMFEGATGVVFIAVFLSRLVSLFSTSAPDSHDRH